MLQVIGLLLFTATVLAQTDPPASGDWTVSDATLIENTTVDLRGNLTVEAGGDLTLRNVTLRVHSTSEVMYGILVEAGGKLLVDDADHIMQPNVDPSVIMRGSPSWMASDANIPLPSMGLL